MTNDAKLQILLTAKDVSDREFERFQGKIKSISVSVAKMAAGFATAAGAVGLGLFVAEMKKGVDAASDFEETASKVVSLFGSGEAAEIERWGQNAAFAMGLSKQAAMEAVGTMGNMFLQLGAGAEKASDLSQEMVQLSADFASFHNVAGGAEEVLVAIQAGFRGEYDALQRYIPTINAAAVEHQALADTGKKTAKGLTALEKALAVQKIVVRDAGAALGDFARTSESGANVSRRLDAALDDLSATLGKKLLPVVTEVKSGLADMAVNLNKALIGPSIDEQLSAVKARIDLLMAYQNNKEEELAKRRKEREERHAATVERFKRLNVGPVNSQSRYYKDVFERRRKAELLKTPFELELERLTEQLEYLQDLKRFQLMEAHQAMLNTSDESIVKPKFLGFSINRSAEYARKLNAAVAGIELEYKTNLAKSDNWAEDSRRLNQLEKNMLVDADLDQWFGDLDKIENRYDDFSNKMVSISETTAEKMQGAFSDFFFDVMQGNIKSIEDYWKSILESINKMVADYLSELAAAYLKNFLINSFSGSSAYSGTAGSGGGVGTLNASGYSLQQRAEGGPVMPGRRYIVGENGPELLEMGNMGGFVYPNRSSGEPGQAGNHKIEFHFSPNISAIDTRSGAQFLRAHRHSIMGDFVDALKHNPSLSKFIAGR